MTNAARIEAGPMNHHEADDTALAVASDLARIGVRLAAQRVELFRAVGDSVHLEAWWGSLGHEQNLADCTAEISDAWFPWSLGNLRPAESLFVENAATLRCAPGGGTIGELGFNSALHLPLFTADRLVGATCVYWAREQSGWDTHHLDQLREWIGNALCHSGVGRVRNSGIRDVGEGTLDDLMALEI